MGISKNHLSILIISFTIACFFIFISETTYYTKFLHLYNIDHLSPTFIDFRSYQSLVETVEAGFNPYIEHPFDPKLRPFNLPYIWFYISKFIYLKSEIIFKFVVLLFIFLYVNSSLQIASIYKNLKHKIFIYFLLFSSSSMLLVERGNTDMLIYGLIFYSAYNFNFSRSVFFLSLASILKLYPIFAFTLNFYKKKNFFTSLFLITLVTLTFFSQLKYLLFNTHSTYDTGITFGINSIAKGIIKSLDRLDITFLDTYKIDSYIFFYLAVVIFVIIYLFINFKKNATNFDKVFINNIENRLFIGGASIYSGSFLFFSSYDYRLVFLILTIPYFYKNLSLLSILFFVSVVISLNSILIYSLAQSPVGYLVIGLILHILKFLIFLILSNELMKFFFAFLKDFKKVL